ncbi:MAG: M20 family metallopeptidase [Deltaproteobacteria bacterium]|nr:M20 family metallopeptidase [Deltaproteobacteria bacterium]
MLNEDTLRARSEHLWESEIISEITEYIRIPNKSPMFDRDWASAGHMDRAVALIETWCRKQMAHIPGLTVEVVRLKHPDGSPRTPVIYIEAPATGDAAKDDVVLLYGHLDKQPEMTGWREGLGPWIPVREGDKLYGRGGADDGYAAFASLAALRLLQEQGATRVRCAVLIEACEESGSFDLPAYIEHLMPRIGTPSLVVCLDSGCANYDQLWMTTSLRGLVAGDLTVKVLNEGVHSGDASGIVASSFRIQRMLLERIEDMESGVVTVDELHTEIPEQRQQQAQDAARSLGWEIFSKFPFVSGSMPMQSDLKDMILARTWRPTLSVTGVDGMPPLHSAGNVLRPYTTLKLSIRIPPRVDPEVAAKAVKEVLEADPPYGSEVTFNAEKSAPGWDAPPLADWLGSALTGASQTYFGQRFMAMGEGGTIPFMGMLGERFPSAQFLITGVLGPASNAHGPNEFLHIPTAKKLTCCVAHVLVAHAARAV